MYSAVFLFLALITHADDNFDCIECAYDDPACEECAGRRQLSVDCIECAYDDPACEECAGRRQLSVETTEMESTEMETTTSMWTTSTEMESTEMETTTSMWMTSTTEMESTTDMEFADCGEYEQLGNSRECFGKGAGCVGAGWFSKNNTGKIDATQVCLDQGYEGVDPEQYGGNWGDQCRHPGNSLTHFNKAGGALTNLGMTVSWKCLGGTPQTDSDGATDCTIGADSNSTIAEVLDELTCLCDEHKATGWLREDREPLTPTLQGLIVLLKNAPTATDISPGRKFLKRWNRLVGRAYAVTHEIEHNSEIDRRIWRKGCRAIRSAQTSQNLDIWADKFD